MVVDSSGDDESSSSSSSSSSTRTEFVGLHIPPRTTTHVPSICYAPSRFLQRTTVATVLPRLDTGSEVNAKHSETMKT